MSKTSLMFMRRALLILFTNLILTLNGAEENDNFPASYLFLLDPYIRTSFTTVNNSKVGKIYKRRGDAFMKGDLLIQLENIIQQSMYNKAMAAMEKAKVTFESKKILYEGKVASFDEFITLKTELAIAENDVAIAKKNLDDCAVIAPYDGRVSFLNVEEQEYPNHEFYYKDKPMMEIIYEKTLLAKILIPASILPQIYPDQKVLLKLNETGAYVFASILRIGAVIDPASGTVLIDAKVDNQDMKLMAGMTGTAIIQTSEDRRKYDAP